MKLIIDTDPGVDDAMAILYAAAAPEIDLLGLTTVFGNVTVETATRNALRLVEMAGLKIPVARGAKGSMQIPMMTPSAHVHGAEGFGDVPAAEPEGNAIDEQAAEYLVRMARQHRNELVVCAIGPITNVAQAIQLDPDFATNVKKIVLMGGAVFVPGNITPVAEANTYHDPHALNIVLASGADVILVGLDVTMKILCTADDFRDLEHHAPEFGGFLRRASHFYLDFYRTVVGIEGCGLHDPAAVIACTHPELFAIETHRIEVVEDGAEKGRTLVCQGQQGFPAGVCVGGNMDQIKARFMEISRTNP